MTERRAVEWDQRWRVALIDPGDFTRFGTSTFTGAWIVP